MQYARVGGRYFHESRVVAYAMPAPYIVAEIPSQLMRQTADSFAHSRSPSLVFGSRPGATTHPILGKTPAILVGPAVSRGYPRVWVSGCHICRGYWGLTPPQVQKRSKCACRNKTPFDHKTLFPKLDRFFPTQPERFCTWRIRVRQGRTRQQDRRLLGAKCRFRIPRRRYGLLDARTDV